MATEKRTTNPSSQMIKDDDVEVHNFLLNLANRDGAGQHDREALILASGLAAIHERLGDIWIWMKEWRA